MAEFRNIDNLKSQLLTSGLSEQNQPLFQVINTLIDAYRSLIQATSAITGGGGGGGGLTNLSYLTKNDDSGALPNSLQTLAGPGIQFSDVGNRRVIRTALPFAFDNLEEQPLELIPYAPSQLPIPEPTVIPPIPPGMPLPFDNYDEEPLDLIPPASGQLAAAVITFGKLKIVSFTQDLGIGRSGNFTLTLPPGAYTSVIGVVQTSDPIATKGNATDEFEMDAIVLNGRITTTTNILIEWFAANGSIVVGAFNFQYVLQ